MSQIEIDKGMTCSICVVHRDVTALFMKDTDWNVWICEDCLMAALKIVRAAAKGGR